VLKNKKNLRVLKIIVSVSLLSYLFYLADLRFMLGRLRNVDPTILVFAVPLLLTQAAISTLKWKLILQMGKIYGRFIFLLKIYLKGNFFSLFLPTSFGGDVYRVHSIHTTQGKWRDGVSSVLFDRITGLFALVTIGVAAYASLPKPEYLTAILLLYLLGISSFLLATSEIVYRKLENINRRWLRKLLFPIKSFAEYRRTLHLLLPVIAIAFLFQFNVVIANQIYCAALDIDIPFRYLLVIVPAVYLTEILPISINGIGVRDSAFALSFSMLGYKMEDGLAVALLVILVRYTVGLAGGLVLLKESFETKKSC